jgi:hypothetical protein
MVFMMSAFAKAQCSMCRAVIESSGNENVAEGLNNGITYLMVFPYLLVGAIIFLVYRNTQTRPEDHISDEA